MTVIIPSFVRFHLTAVIRDSAGVCVGSGRYSIFLVHFAFAFTSLYFSVSLFFFLTSHFFFSFHYSKAMWIACDNYTR